MLVLSRKPGESIHIDSDIRVVVISVSHGRVKLGIDAPNHIRILRSELAHGESDVAIPCQMASAKVDRSAPLVPR